MLYLVYFLFRILEKRKLGKMCDINEDKLAAHQLMTTKKKVMYV